MKVDSVKFSFESANVADVFKNIKEKKIEINPDTGEINKESGLLLNGNSKWLIYNNFG